MNKLKELRKNRKLTQNQLSEESGITLRSIQAYEQEYRDIKGANIETLMKLSKALKCKIKELLE